MEQRPLDDEQELNIPSEDDERVSRARLRDGQTMHVKPGNLAAAKDALAAQRASEREGDDGIDSDDFRSVEPPH